MEKIAQDAALLFAKNETEIREKLKNSVSGVWRVLPDSIHKLGNAIVLAVENPQSEKHLLVIANFRRVLPEGFPGEIHRLADGTVYQAEEFQNTNAAALQRYFPWCRPTRRNGRIRHLQIQNPGSWNPLASPGRFPIFPEWRDGVFQVFLSNYRNPFGIGGPIRDYPGEIPQDHSRSWLTLRPIIPVLPGTPANPERVREYAERTFYGNGQNIFFSATAAEACETALGPALDTFAESGKFWRKRNFDLELKFPESSASFLREGMFFLARELRKCGLECEVFSAESEITPEDGAVISGFFPELTIQ